MFADGVGDKESGERVSCKIEESDTLLIIRSCMTCYPVNCVTSVSDGYMDPPPYDRPMGRYRAF